MILVDTNILLRLAQPGHPHRQPALDAIELLTVRDAEHFVIVPQCLYEMYVVCSRAATANGLGMTPQRAHADLAGARAVFQLLPDTANICFVWDRLVAQYAVQGKQSHDARLVAAMIEHRVPKLLTFNDGDLKRYSEIVTLNPFDVLGVPRL